MSSKDPSLPIDILDSDDSDADSIIIENETEELIQLGILEEVEDRKLNRFHFPSKCGGKPLWLIPQNIPSIEQLTCKICNGNLSFLLQVYCPLEFNTAFHRVLYIFICKNGKCTDSNSMKVVRSQLPRKNNFYDYKPISLDTYPDDSIPSLCELCGIYGTKKCGKCKLTFYCSRTCQSDHWSSHKLVCGMSNDDVPQPKYPFPQYEIFTEEEDTHNINLNVKESKMLEQYKINSKEEMNTIDEEDKDDAAPETVPEESPSNIDTNKKPLPEIDAIFAAFSTRISYLPEQVLRYSHSGSPLWPIPSFDIAVPLCQYCHGPKIFELQILPQILYFLKVATEEGSLDFGSLFIYTCKNSCDSGPDYKEEFIFRLNPISN